MTCEKPNRKEEFLSSPAYGAEEDDLVLESPTGPWRTPKQRRRDFADTFVAFARGQISKAEMNEATERLSRDIVKNYKPRKDSES